MNVSIILSGECTISGPNDTVNANGLNGGILDNRLKSKAFWSYAPCASIDGTYRRVNQRRQRTLVQTWREHAKSAQKG